MIAFSVICILAGAVVGFLGPRLFPAKPQPACVQGASPVHSQCQGSKG